MLKNYFKTAIAVLKRNKFFTFISLFGISFTLAVLMILTAFTDHIMGENYPEINADRCLYVMNLQFTDEKRHNQMNTGPSFDFLNKYVKTLKSPEKVTISNLGVPATAYFNNKKYSFKLANTDAEFWEVMHFNFLEGRGYTTKEILNNDRVAVISEETKKLYFGDNSAVGKNISAGDINYKVIGVITSVPITRFLTCADIYAPYTAPKSGYDIKTLQGSYHAVIMCKSKDQFKSVDDELQHKVAHIPIPDKNFNIMSIHADTFLATFTRVGLGNPTSNGIDKVYFIITLLLFLFFLLPTVNLVNLNISRILERSSEIGVRKAFGASSRTLIIQFLIENLVLTIIGGIVGLMITLGVLTYINSSNLIPNIHLRVDLNVLTYSLVLCVVFGIFSGVYPAFRMSRMEIIKSLKSAS